MESRRSVAVVTALVILVLFAAQVALATTAYTITVATDASSYTAGQQIKVTGLVSPAPNAPTGVTLRIFNPSGVLVAAAETGVGASTGSYNYTFVAGGTSSWTDGTYTVNATWGAFPPTISQKTTFTYATTVTTTTSTSTSSSSSTTSTTSSSSSSSTTSSSSSTSTSSSSKPTTSSTSSSTTSSSSSSSTSSSSSSGGGGIPEFPFQAALAGLVVVAVVVGYLLTRRSAAHHTIIPSVR